MKEMKEDEMLRRETLSNFLQEYESQTENFRDHITFKDFCKIKVERSKLNIMDIFYLSTFDGSPTCSTKSLVEELHTYLQQHQVYENEAIRVAALHFEGKAYAWWMFESFSSKNVNTSSFAKFTKRLVGRFDKEHETIKPRQIKLLHKLEGPTNSKPLQKPIEEAHILHDTLLEARSLFHNLGQEGMKVPFAKEDPLIEQLPPIHI